MREICQSGSEGGGLKTMSPPYPYREVLVLCDWLIVFDQPVLCGVERCKLGSRISKTLIRRGLVAVAQFPRERL